jgi:two-component system cell cycle sensor histidine kinase PleC
VEQGQTPYQKMMAPPSQGAPARAPAQTPVPPQAPPPLPPQAQPVPSPAFTPAIAPVKADADMNAIDKNGGKNMVILAVAFLVFYALLASAKLINDYSSDRTVAGKHQLTQTSGNADQISSAIDNTIVWIKSGMNQSANPGQAVRFMTRSPSITGAVILNNKNKIIAAYPNNATYLAQASMENIQANTVKVDSIPGADGTVTPIIIHQTGNIYAVVAIANNVFVKSTFASEGEKVALVTRSEKIIDGSAPFGLKKPSEAFGISDSIAKRLTEPGKRTSDRLKINGENYQLASVQIPNSKDLFLFRSKPVARTSILKNNLTLFAILFLGTCVIILLLLNSLYKQLGSVREIQKKTQISQQRFRAAVEGDRGGVWEIDLVNNTAFLSASLAALLGMPRDEHRMPVSQFLGLFHPQDRERFLSSARRAHMQGEFDFDLRIAHLPLILQCRGRPSTRTGSEQNRMVVGVAHDITEQRGAQTRLIAAETRLHDALSSMTDSFVVWDAMKRLVVWNLRFEDFFGLKPGMLQPGMDQVSIEYMIGPAIAEVLPPNANDGAMEIMLVDGRCIRYIETQTREGGHVSVGTNISEIRSREDELHENEKALQNTVGILKKSQEGIFELAQRYEEEKIRAEEANQSKSDFLANMSHELRTPLNAINGFSDIMQKEMFGPLGDPRYKEYVNDILFSGQHLLALINDILDMSKIEAGKMTLNTEFMYMHDMIAQVVRIIRGRAEESQLTLDITGTEGQEIEADPRAVKQILLNLLTNAIKFTPENGKVSVNLIPKKSGIIVKVTDSGIGISQENIDRLAKPFEQVVDQSTKHKEGTGLGLALSKSLIELHGGNFKIESTLGQGTTVIFSLPNRPIIRAEEPKDNQVTQEISRLANDIANVLAENETKLGDTLLPEDQVQMAHEPPTATEPQAGPPPNPYENEQPAHPSDRPAA